MPPSRRLTPEEQAGYTERTVQLERARGGAIAERRFRLTHPTTELGNQAVKLKEPVKNFVLSRQGVMWAWFIAMIIIGFDEWVNLQILPRPSRLWHTSVVYGILALGSSFEQVAPILNLMAWGYTLVLLYQYYNDSGQFSPPPKQTGKKATNNPPAQQGPVKTKGPGVRPA